MSRGTIATGIGAIACLVPIWACGYLPMVDLPQHAAQVALWVHRDDPVFFPEGVYRFNWFTPYLGAYLVARIFAAFFAVPLAMKLTVSLAALLVPLATRALLRITGGDPWWTVVAAPLAFGVSFYSGFLNFMMAIPFTILVIAAVLGFARTPTRRTGGWIVLSSLGLAICHALAFAVGVVVAVAALWGADGDRRTRWRGTVFALAPLPLVAVWAVSVWLRESHVRSPMRWDGLPSRLFRTPSVLVGSTEAVAALVALAVVVVVLFALGVRLRRDRAILAALASAGAFYLAAPDAVFHTVVLPERFPALLAVLVLSLARLPESMRARRAVVALAVALVLGWSAHLTIRFRAFDREMAGLDRVLAATVPGKILRMIPIDARSRAVPGYPLFWNAGAWYQVDKGGHVGFSFSQLFPVLIQYRSTPAWAEPIWAKRGELNWRDADREVDYFLFRSEAVIPEGLFPEDADRPRSVATSGAWRLFAKAPRRAGGSRWNTIAGTGCGFSSPRLLRGSSRSPGS